MNANKRIINPVLFHNEMKNEKWLQFYIADKSNQERYNKVCLARIEEKYGQPNVFTIVLFIHDKKEVQSKVRNLKNIKSIPVPQNLKIKVECFRTLKGNFYASYGKTAPLYFVLNDNKTTVFKRVNKKEFDTCAVARPDIVFIPLELFLTVFDHYPYFS